MVTIWESIPKGAVRKPLKDLIHPSPLRRTPDCLVVRYNACALDMVKMSIIRVYRAKRFLALAAPEVSHLQMHPIDMLDEWARTHHFATGVPEALDLLKSIHRGQDWNFDHWYMMNVREMCADSTARRLWDHLTAGVPMTVFWPRNAQSFWWEVLTKGRSERRRAGSIGGRTTSTPRKLVNLYLNMQLVDRLTFHPYDFPLILKRKAWQSKWVWGFPPRRDPPQDQPDLHMLANRQLSRCRHFHQRVNLFSV